MTSAMKKRLWFVPVLLLSLPLALAQAPSGPIGFSFDRTTFPVWDFTGPYQLDLQIVGTGGLTDLSVPFFLSHDLAGRLRGSGGTLVTIGSDVVAANFTLNGAVGLSGTNTRATFSLRLTGQDIIAGQTRSFSISLTCSFRVDPDPAKSPAWIAPVRGNAVQGSVNISGLGVAQVIPNVAPGADFALALPPHVDGVWSLNMNILALTRLSGVATLVVDNSSPGLSILEPGTRTLNTTLTGTYRPSLTFSQVLLTGTADSRGTSLLVSWYNGANLPSQMLGKVLGQTINISF